MTTRCLAVLLLAGLGEAAAPDRREPILDPILKVLYRAQRGAGEVSLGRAQELLGRFRPQPREPELAARAASAVSLPSKLSLLVKHGGDPATLERAGLVLGACAGPICAGSLPQQRLADLVQVEGLEAVELSRELKALTEPVGASSSAAQPTLPERHASTASGAGVLVAFIDTGVDIFHTDFRKADGTTRIRALLDLSLPGDTNRDGDLDGTGPFGGTLFTEADITAALASGRFPSKDVTGHGTHGLSIAAGDAGPEPHLAPDGDLLVVKATRESSSLGFFTADLVNALAWIDGQATQSGIPYVVNLSLGSLFGSHDGRSLEEQAIDSIVGPGKPGKVAVIAAGNASDNRSNQLRHLTGTAYVGIATSHTLTVPEYTPSPGKGDDRIVLDLWYEGRDELDLTVTAPDGASVTAPFGRFQDERTTAGDVFIANMGGANPENGDIEAIILIDDWSGTPPRSGDWTITVTASSVSGSGVYHGWLQEDSVTGGKAAYLSGNADDAYLVGRPGTAYHGITVGSYAKHEEGTRFLTSWTDLHGVLRQDTSAIDGQISDFSSPGPTRDGRRKPEITAPGERVMGAVSKDAYPGVSPTSVYQYRDPSQPVDALIVDDATNAAFGMLQGTSFSAPVVSGLVARILAQSPTLDAIQVRNMLINSAETDGATGAEPSDAWGYGKADLDVGSGAPLPSDLRITVDAAPPGAVGEQYNLVLTASGGTPPYAWSMVAGALPPGLSFLPSGLLTGVPTVAGSFAFTIQVADGSSSQETATHTYALTIAATAPLEITTTMLPVAHLGEAYRAQLQVKGGAPPYTWDVGGGSLPPGLGMDTTGRISGNPITLGRWSFTVRVVDAALDALSQSTLINVQEMEEEHWHALGKVAPSVHLLAVDPRNPSRVLAATRNIDGVFETTNAGQSWHPISINTGLNDFVVSLDVNPVTSEAWGIRKRWRGPYGSEITYQAYWYDPAAASWHAIGEPTCCLPHAIGFSTDGRVFSIGSSPLYLVESVLHGDWVQAAGSEAGPLCGSGIGSVSVASISVHGLLNQTYVLRTDAPGAGPPSRRYTCVSTDGGLTWHDVSNSSEGWVDIQVSSGDPLSVVKAGATEHYGHGPPFVERSLDGGRNWEKSNVSNFKRVVGLLSLQLRRSQSDPSVALFACDDGLHKTEDGGVTWRAIEMDLADKAITAVAIDPSDANVYYAASSNGVYRSNDGGESWIRASDGLIRRQLGDMRMSVTKPDELVLASIEGPYLSRSAGTAWTKSVAGLTNTVVRRVAVSSQDADLYFAGTDGGVFRSANHGASWTRVDGTSGDGYSCKALETAPHDERIVLYSLSGTRGTYRSTDGGRTFAPANAGLPYGTPNDLSFARDATHAGLVYIALTNDGVYRSESSGLSWSLSGLAGQTSRAVEVAPTNADYVYAAGNTAMYRREPTTAAWQKATTNPASPVLCIGIDPLDPTVAYAGADHPGVPGRVGGIYKTTDGGRTWQRLPGVLDQFDVVSIATHPTTAGLLHAATSLGGVFRSTDGGVGWELLSNYGTVADLTNVSVQDPSNPFLLFAGTEGFGVQVSADGGKTFVPRVQGLTNYYVNAIAFDPDDPARLYAGTDDGVFVSTDSAQTWSPSDLTQGEVTGIVTDNEGTARRIWVTVAGEGVAYSADGGAHFSVFSTGLDSLRLTSLEVERLGTSARRIWVTTKGGSGVAYSEDLGRSWVSAAGNGLTDRSVNDLAIDGTARRIWVTTDSGVFFSEDSGASWRGLSAGLPGNMPVRTVSVDPYTGEALVGLGSDHGGGVYRGGVLTGRWREFGSGLGEVSINKLTNDDGRAIDPSTLATTFYAATQGDGVYQAELRTAAGPSPIIATTSLPKAFVRFNYSATLSAAGATPPYEWGVVEGALPVGLTLVPATGVISGQPVRAERATFTVQVADSQRRTSRSSLTIAVARGRPLRRVLQ